MVKKRLASGAPCPKCVQAQELLDRRGLAGRIDRVLWAQEGDPASEGMLLGAKHGVDGYCPNQGTDSGGAAKAGHSRQFRRSGGVDGTVAPSPYGASHAHRTPTPKSPAVGRYAYRRDNLTSGPVESAHTPPRRSRCVPVEGPRGLVAGPAA